LKLNKVIAPTLTAQVPASATVIYVNSATGTDSPSSAGNTEAAPKTITYALSQAQPNTVIQLAPGNYTSETGKSSHWLSNKALRIHQRQEHLWRSLHQSNPSRQDVTVRAEKEHTTGVTITNANTRGTALWIESTNPTVKNNTFANSNRDGILSPVQLPQIEDNVSLGTAVMAFQ